jgi:hypothetical protein
MRGITILLKYGYKSLMPFSPIFQFFRGSQFNNHEILKCCEDYVELKKYILSVQFQNPIEI